MHIYILVGCSGAYEDYSEWMVGAFRSEEQATLYKQLCEKYVSELFVAEDYGFLSEEKYTTMWAAIDKAKNDPTKPDPDVEFSSYGTWYDVRKVKVMD